MPENNPHMPSLVSIPTYRYRVRGKIHGQTTLADFYYTAQAGATPSTNIGTDIETFWAFMDNFWTDTVSAEWELDAILGRRVDLYGQPFTLRTKAVLLALGNVVQGQLGESCPPQDAVCIKKITATVGKRGRGRWFFSGVAEADHLAGQLTPAALTRWQTFADAHETPLVLTGGGYAPAHCFHEEFPSEVDPTTGVVVLEGRLITSATADETVRSQRRRQVGRGI